MRKVILYIAVSLDGYIADSHGSVDWIGGEDETAEMEDTFTPFFSSIDTVVMGRTTYRQIVSELSPGHWPYAGAVTYVLTHHPDADDTDTVRFRNRDASGLVEELQRQPGKDIWICGGAELARQLIADNRIDVYHLAIVPVILGNGIRLFGPASPKIKLKMIGTKAYNGMVEIVYRRS